MLPKPDLQLGDSREIFDREIIEAHKKLTGDAPLRSGSADSDLLSKKILAFLHSTKFGSLGEPKKSPLKIISQC